MKIYDGASLWIHLTAYYFCNKIFIIRAVGSFFMVGGLSKNVDHQGWPTTKSTLKLSPKNEDLDQNINDSKISYLEFFFWKYYFGHTKFLYLSRRSSGYHQSFFLISDFLAENLKANKNLQKRSHVLQYSFAQKLHYYTNINSLDIENNMLPQHNQKP